MPKEVSTSVITTHSSDDTPYVKVSRKKANLGRIRRREKMLAREISALQCSTSNIIPSISFSRVVREVLQDMGEYSMRGSAMRALQCAAEAKITDMFAEAHKLAQYQKRDTVVQSDIHFILPKSERAPVVSAETDS